MNGPCKRPWHDDSIRRPISRRYSGHSGASSGPGSGPGDRRGKRRLGPGKTSGPGSRCARLAPTGGAMESPYPAAECALTTLRKAQRRLPARGFAALAPGDPGSGAPGFSPGFQGRPSFCSMWMRISRRTTCDGVRSSRRHNSSKTAFLSGSISMVRRAVRVSRGMPCVVFTRDVHSMII